MDNLSKGVEVELTTQITRNWNVTLNYTHVNSTHENIDEADQVFISKLTGWYNGPAGQVRMWCNQCGSPIGPYWDSQIVAPWTVELNEQGPRGARSVALEAQPCHDLPV